MGERRAHANPAGVVEREVVVAAPPEAVLPYWLDPALLTRWMGNEAKVDARPGGELVIRYANGAVMRGEVLEVEAPSRLVFSWGWEDEAEVVRPGGSRVEVTLTPVPAGTRVHVRHLDLPDGEREGHAEGWDYFLGRLAVAIG